MLIHRKWRLLAVVAALGVLAGAVVAATREDGGAGTVIVPAGEREPAPRLVLPDLADPRATLDLAALRGTPVVVNFWAAWCAPCRRELPDLQAGFGRLDGRVAFLGVDHMDDRGRARRLLARTGVRYPSGFDPTGAVARSFGLLGMPTTVFVAADGTIAGRHTGPITAPQLAHAVKRLFGVEARA